MTSGKSYYVVQSSAEQYLIPSEEQQEATSINTCIFRIIWMYMDFPSFRQLSDCGIIYCQAFVHFLWEPSRRKCRLYCSNLRCYWFYPAPAHWHFIIGPVFLRTTSLPLHHTVRYFPNGTCTISERWRWGNRKPYASYRMVSLSMTLSDPWPGFQGRSSFKRRISPKRRISQTVTI